MARSHQFKLSLVVPAYNEAENIGVLVDRLAAQARDFADVEIIIVDDGSTDSTATQLRHAAERHAGLRVISLSRNFGHQPALRAGFQHATGDCVICLDANLQHPPELIPELVRRWQAGADIVNTIRQDFASPSLFKRMSSRLFHKGLSALSGLKLVPGSSDFRLLDCRVVDILNLLPENDLFYLGVVPTLGFAVDTVTYKPNVQLHGGGKASLRRSTRLALKCVLSSSLRPLRLAGYFALLTALAALAFLAYVLYASVFTSAGAPGWTSAVGAVLVIGTMQLLVLGVIGEYLGQVLKEARRRPPYHVAQSSSGATLTAERLAADLRAARKGQRRLTEVRPFEHRTAVIVAANSCEAA